MIELTHITRENYTRGTAGYDKTGTRFIYVNPANIAAFVDGTVYLTGGQTFEVTQTAKQIQYILSKV